MSAQIIDRLTLRVACCVSLCVPILAGCGGGSLPPRAEPERAREALATALDTWKRGDPVQELAKGDPPVYFTDLSHRAGKRLVSYEIRQGHDFHGQSVMLTATLALEGEGGTVRRKQTVYQIETHPAIVIVPGGF